MICPHCGGLGMVSVKILPEVRKWWRCGPCGGRGWIVKAEP